MARPAGQAKAGTEPAQAAIAPGRPETPAGVPRVRKREVYHLKPKAGPACEPEYRTMAA